MGCIGAKLHKLISTFLLIVVLQLFFSQDCFQLSKLFLVFLFDAVFLLKKFIISLIFSDAYITISGRVVVLFKISYCHSPACLQAGLQKTSAFFFYEFPDKFAFFPAQRFFINNCIILDVSTHKT